MKKTYSLKTIPDIGENFKLAFLARFPINLLFFLFEKTFFILMHTSKIKWGYELKAKYHPVIFSLSPYKFFAGNSLNNRKS